MVPTAVFAVPTMIQPGGRGPSARDSNVSVHGGGRTTRARASPAIAPAAALIVPACSTTSGAGLNVPSGATVPFNPASDQLTPDAGPMRRPCLSNALACSFTGWPGLTTSSVGDTSSHAGSPAPLTAASSTAKPVGFVAVFGPMAYTPPLD